MQQGIYIFASIAVPALCSAVHLAVYLTYHNTKILVKGNLQFASVDVYKQRVKFKLQRSGQCALQTIHQNTLQMTLFQLVQ